MLSILAVVAAAWMPQAAAGQIAPEKQKPAEPTEPVYKWEAFAGYGYTSLNMINQSRYGLQGVNVAVTRDWGKHFGITGDGAFYSTPLSSASPGNPGNPSVDLVLFGPVARFNLFGHFDGFVHCLLGGEHIGGENQTPTISFAGGGGGGMEYKFSPHFSLRASGDDIASSFSFINNSPALAYSPHVTRSSRATFGLVYRF